ncbi:exonuclease SbcCD subunit D [Arthrobacter halodurans]|uniref:Nuclease SbcCD subunit D n=1 Tax=Arthrobacter halodurans TaxID=516699 RepID=A0ABV4UI75_9MICC
MRLLHTSDWHLGRSFHGAGLLDAQRGFIDELVRTVTERRIDVVLIAGDVYDRALPGVDVVALFDDALVRLRNAGAQVVVSSGNHDSATRLGFGGRLFAEAGLHLRTRLDEAATPAVFERDGHSVAVYALPYLEPRMVAERLGVAAPGHAPVVEAALALVREDLAERRAASAVPVAAVVLAHVFAAGGKASTSERELGVGGLDVVPVSHFAGFDYVALGHLHGHQELAEHVRYSGSPLPYSFSEAGHSKGAVLVELSADGLRHVERIEWPAPKRLAVLRGELDALLGDSALAWAEQAWCQVTLTDSERPGQAMERLRRRFPDTLVLAFEPEGRAEGAPKTYGDRLREAEDPLGVCEGFVEHVRERRTSDAESRLLRDVLGAAAAAEVSA